MVTMFYLRFRLSFNRIREIVAVQRGRNRRTINFGSVVDNRLRSGTIYTERSPALRELKTRRRG